MSCLRTHSAPLWRVAALFLALCLACPEPGVAQAPDTAETSVRRAMQASDWLQVQDVEDAVLSPDGRYVAYTVRRTRPAGDGRAPTVQTPLFVAAASGRTPPRLLTRSDAHAPTWHPDGDYVAFVRSVDGTPQLFVVPFAGGEPYQLTDTRHGATAPQWGPRGERLLFASAVPGEVVQRRTGRLGPSERPGRTPQDTLRTTSPDTLVVLRDAVTLNAVDTLAMAPDGGLQPRPGTPLRASRLDTLRTAPPDSLPVVLNRLGVRRDTVTVPAPAPPAPSPDGSLDQVRRWLDRSAKQGRAAVTTRLDFESHPRPTYRHYFMVRTPSGMDRGFPPRPDPVPVTEGYRSFGEAAWLPNGTQIVVSGTPPLRQPIDRVHQRDLFIVDLPNTGATASRSAPIRRLLRLQHHALSAPRVTRDGTTIAFLARDLRDGTRAQTEVGLFALDGRSKPQLITPAFDRDVEAARWSPDGWYVYATAPSREGRPLYRFAPFAVADTTQDARRAAVLPPLDDGSVSRDSFAVAPSLRRTVEPERLTASSRRVQAFDVTDATVIYAAGSPGTPAELFSNTAGFSRERQLSALNTEWLATRRLSAPQPVRAVSAGSLAVEGTLLPPVPRPDTVQAPLLVLLRDGPPALTARRNAATWHAAQFLAARGFAVLQVAPRGSDGQGQAYQRRSFQNWGPGPMADVLALADAAAARPGVDSTRQVLMGTGYGATLAAWIVSQTDRFEAAVAHQGTYALPALVGDRAWRLVPDHFGGYPWDGDTPPPAGSPDSLTRPDSMVARSVAPDSLAPRAALVRNAPLTYVDSIRTPLLLMHAAGDPRASASHTERLYRSLKILERPVELVRYPAAGSDAPMRHVDRLVRTYEFLARYARPGM